MNIYNEYYLYQYASISNPLTRCGHVIVERITMSTCKATKESSLLNTKKNKRSKDYVFNSGSKKTGKADEISPTEIGKRPIYMFFIDFEGKYFPIRCMLNVGSTLPTPQKHSEMQ